MKSTGEVMGIDRDFDLAFGKALIAAGITLPDSGTVFVSVKDADKDNILPAVEKMVELGYSHHRDRRDGRPSRCARASPVERVNKVAQGRPHIVDRLMDGDVAARLQHDGGLAVAEGQPFDPFDGADAQSALLHDGGGQPGRGTVHRGASGPRA